MDVNVEHQRRKLNVARVGVVALAHVAQHGLRDRRLDLLQGADACFSLLDNVQSMVSGRDSELRCPAHLISAITSLSGEAGLSADDHAMDSPFSIAAADREIGIFPITECSGDS